MENSQMRWMRRGKFHFVVGRRAHARVSRLQPFQPDERKPAVRLLQSRRALFAKLGNLLLPSSLLPARRPHAGKSQAKERQRQSKKGLSPHRKSIARAANCTKSG